MITTERLISLRDAAALLGGISVRTVRRRIAAGVLPQPVYLGRKPTFVLSELLQVIEQLKAKRKALA
jgi:predicted DNA-binding transcriptional regulator AlpA